MCDQRAWKNLQRSEASGTQSKLLSPRFIVSLANDALMLGGEIASRFLAWNQFTLLTMQKSLSSILNLIEAHGYTSLKRLQNAVLTYIHSVPTYRSSLPNTRCKTCSHFHHARLRDSAATHSLYLRHITKFSWTLSAQSESNDTSLHAHVGCATAC
jgi:cob(I)alamin adenosyltransferase